YQPAVGVEHADQREGREVVALGEQLRADQDVSFPAPDGFQRARELLPASRAVAVDADDACVRKARSERLLDALRAAPHGFEIHVAAGGARTRDRAFGAAVMATQAAVGICPAVWVCPSIGG